jgi:hypothetical protein
MVRRRPAQQCGGGDAGYDGGVKSEPSESETLPRADASPPSPTAGQALPVVGYATPSPASGDPPRLLGSLAWAVLLNVIANLFCLGFKDGGAISRQCVVASAAFWAATATYLAVRRGRPTAFGAAGIALGFPAVAAVTFAVWDWFR